MTSLGWGNMRQRLGQTLQKGALEPREPREGAIRRPCQRRWTSRLKEGKTCQAIVREMRLPPPETGFF